MSLTNCNNIGLTVRVTLKSLHMELDIERIQTITVNIRESDIH